MSLKQAKQSYGRMRQVRPVRRQAVTLVEVLLVLVLLTLIAATAWPSLERSFADQRLRDAADLVRAEWSSSRAKAMHSGVAQQFHYMPEEQTYWVEASEDVLGSSNESLSMGANEPGSNHLTLPDKIYFHEGVVQEKCSPSSSADQLSQTTEADPLAIEDGEPDAPIVFYPDGTCTPARLVLKNEYDKGITLTIRSLTGMSDVGEIFYVEDYTP